MIRQIHKIISVLLMVLLLISSFGVTTFADELRAGTVAGLPEKLVVLDDKGNSVSENGEYFFAVENMNAGEHYTKKIQIMNLREDASYHIDFRAQPISASGEIDLENDCQCVVSLDGNTIYEGKVTGEGTPDIRVTPLDLGYYTPGAGRVMTVDIVWIDKGYGGEIDNGARLVDSNGVTIIRGKSGKTHIEGEVIFKWIFTAAVTIPPDDHSDTSDPPIIPPLNPGTPIDTGEAIMLIIFGLAALAMSIMLILVLSKRKKQKEEEKNKQKD